MTQMIPAMIMGFREGLEAFLVVALILRYLTTVGKNGLKNKAYLGGLTGIIGSCLLGLCLFLAANALGGVNTLAKNVNEQVSQNLSAAGIFLIAFAMVMREGTEIAVFSFAGKYSLSAVSTGIGASLVVAFLIYHSLIKVRIDLIFRITLVYLILQAGFLFGYSVHEGLSALKGYMVLSSDNLIFTKVFNFSDTIFNHKNGFVGLPLNVFLGWYSKPEWIQFIVQYAYTVGIFIFWFLHAKKQIKTKIETTVYSIGRTTAAAS